jgi:RNA polymerase sigma-70 factor (ECF subfamily)
MKSQSDEDLMAAITGGDHDAFACLFDRYFRLVLSISLKILRNRPEAEDLMQEVFFELYRKAAEFDPEKGTVKAWIMRCAYSRALNRLAYLRARHFYETPVLTFEPPGPGRRNGLTTQEWGTILEQGIRALTPRQRETLERACYQGQTMKEIADALSETVGNVRNHYYRGLRNLRQFLKEKQVSGD